MARIGIGEWILAACAAVWSSIGVSVHLLLAMMALDFLTGTLCAAKGGELSSRDSLRGLLRKSAVLIVVVTTFLLQQAIEAGARIHFLFHLAQTVALAYCWNEVISILENCACMGAPIPDVLRKILAAVPKMRSTSEEETLS